MSDWTLTRIPLTVLASGAEVQLVLHELAGRRGTGPTLGISAAIHGDEAVGVEILYHLRQRIDPASLRGRGACRASAGRTSSRSVPRTTSRTPTPPRRRP